jgi:hypothetical protein
MSNSSVYKSSYNLELLEHYEQLGAPFHYDTGVEFFCGNNLPDLRLSPVSYLIAPVMHPLSETLVDKQQL